MSKGTQAQRLRELLEDAIIKGRFPPGSRLDPAALEKEFQCSRTPIREAIQQLAISGMVKVLPKRGTFVAQLGVTELIERFEVMANLEALCAQLAARRITEAELTALCQAHERCREKSKEGDTNGYYYENSLFHQCIYEASHNTFLAQESARLHSVLQPYRRMQLQVRHRLESSFKEHQTVVEAIAARDEERAAMLLRNHVMVQGERFNDMVANLQSLQQSLDA